MREMVGGCCVCSDDRGWSENPLVYCDGQSCIVAVHQACYGIVTVPTGPWYCRKCESQERSAKVKCELCPSKYGALKRTDNSGWAHVVCALYIPEVRFGNVTTMEPIQLQLIPPERFNKVCYICQEKGKASSASVGACMQCNKPGCRMQFHVTCAQGLGLLCEEAGNYLDNVKYCGYCQHHYSKLKKSGNVKTIPPYKPVSTENHLSDSNSEKEGDHPGTLAPTTVTVNKVPTTSAVASSSSSSSSQQQQTLTGSNTSGSSGGAGSTKRKSTSSGSKISSSSKSSSSGGTKSSSSHQKTVHNSSSSTSTSGSSKNIDKSKVATAATNSTTGSGVRSVNINNNNNNNNKSGEDNNTSSVGNNNSINIDTSSTLTTITTDSATTTKTDNSNNKRDLKTELVVESIVDHHHMKVDGGKDNNNSSGSGSKNSKKRKVNSRTPTPIITLVPSEATTVNSVVQSGSTTVTTSNSGSTVVSSVTEQQQHQQSFNVANNNNNNNLLQIVSAEKSKNIINASVNESLVIEKPKKLKVETTQSILTNQPVVALTSISTIKSLSSTSSSSSLSSAATTTATIVADLGNIEPPPTVLPTLPIQSIIQTTVNSLVVSVPLTSTSLNPHHNNSGTSVINNNINNNNNQTSVLTATPHLLLPDRGSNNNNNSGIIIGDRSSTSANNSTAVIMTGGNSNPGNTIISSEMSGGGLKITYEKQDSVTTEVDMELEISPPILEVVKRPHSSEKSDKNGRGKKRTANNANGLISQLSNTSISSSSKRSSRSQHALNATTNTTTTQQQPGAFSSITQSQLKDSPPSSPSSESQGAPSLPPQTSRAGRSKGRKSAPAAIPTPGSPKETKDVKLFHNGVSAPHMLGNQLNPTSNMAQKMSDHLNSELEAHSIFIPNDNSNVVGPQLHHRVIASARASSTGGSSTASGGSGLSSMLGGNGGNIPQTLDQLLERQWEQGSQFLMEQAQHFDIASLLSCLHQLRAENLRLEEHVSSLLQRRDHLLAVNARLAIPLTGQPATPQSSHPHTVNNIHPAVAASHGDIPRSSRHSSNSSSGGYPAHPQGSSQHSAVGGPSSSSSIIGNGLPPESTQSYSQHRSSSVAQPQPSPNVRHSPAASSGYSNSGLLRQGADSSGRSAPRPQPYPLYQGPGPSSQQMVIRRDSDMHHQPSSKPS